MTKTMRKTNGATGPVDTFDTIGCIDGSDSGEDTVTNEKHNGAKPENESPKPKPSTHKSKKTGKPDELEEAVDRELNELEEKIGETSRTVEEGVNPGARQPGEKKSGEKKQEDRIVEISERELNRLKQDLADAKDRGLRALAELENYRARTNRVMAEDRKYASVDLARAVLPLWDDMGRALESAEKDLRPAAILDGLKMIYSQFLDIFKREHIEKIEALHEPFDPRLHESIAQVPNAEYPPNTVIHVSQAGFKLHDRVIRPAQVVLAAPMPDSPAKKESAQ